MIKSCITNKIMQKKPLEKNFQKMVLIFLCPFSQFFYASHS